MSEYYKIESSDINDSDCYNKDDFNFYVCSNDYNAIYATISYELIKELYKKSIEMEKQLNDKG